MADFKDQKRGSPKSKTRGFFGDSIRNGPESSCQISAYYKFFLGFSVFCRISTGLQALYFKLKVNVFTVAQSSGKFSLIDGTMYYFVIKKKTV